MYYLKTPRARVLFYMMNGDSRNRITDVFQEPGERMECWCQTLRGGRDRCCILLVDTNLKEFL